MGNPYLEYERRGAKHQVPLQPGDAYRLDRSNLSAVKLDDDPTVSFRHAIVQCVDGGNVYLTDLHSRNGTMLNGRPITVPTLLKAGDLFTVGSCEFVFHHEGAEEIETAEPVDAWSTQLSVSRKLISVLVADIKDYTGLTLRLGESSICDVVGQLFREAGRVLALNASWGQKYIGDAVMGVWMHEGQIPTPREFAFVFRSLLEIRQVFATINRDCGLPESIGFGIGINTGYAALGNMGSRHTPDYTALGDSVNKAFRLESVTRELNVDIVLGSLTYDFLSAVTNVRAGLNRHSVQLKGYPQAEDAYVTDFGTIERILESIQSDAQRSTNVATA